MHFEIELINLITMKRTVLFILGAVFSMLALSCSSESLELEADYDFPFTIETRGDSSSAVEIYQLYLITDTEEDQYADMDFLSCRASLVPGKTKPYMSDETVTLMAYFPDLETLSIGQEMVPVRLHFGYFMSNFSGHVVSKMSGGKIIYRGMKGDKALIEFQNVLFVTARNTYSPKGEHMLKGTMECPVYEYIDEINQ